MNLNELIKDMWKDELSKTGKFNLEIKIKKVLNYKNAWEELYSEKEMPCSIEYMQILEEKNNLGDNND